MKTLRILAIGHSLGNDATYMVPEAFRAHSDTHLIMGVLHHSGCLRGNRAGRESGQDYILIDGQKAILKTCAQKAMASPYAVTKI